MEVISMQGNNNVTSAMNVDKNNSAENKTNSNSQKAGLNIKADGLKLAGDTNSKLKQLFGQKTALKVVLDQFGRDMKVDDAIQGHVDSQEDYLKEASLNQDQIQRLNALKKDLKESFAIEDDSQEQKDLELLEKEVNTPEKLTKEEKARIASMGELTQYQKASLDYTSMAAEFQSRADKAVNQYVNEIRTVDAIKLGLLKDNPMVDAKKEAEDILTKVDEEIQLAIIDEIKNKVNENLEIDPNKNILTDPQSLIDQKKVTEEDLKGLAVDEKV